MISPNTAPGTWVVCIDDRDGIFKHRGPHIRWIGGLDGLKRGEIYRVREVVVTHFKEHPVVRLVEIRRPKRCNGPSFPTPIEGGYALERFRYLDPAADISFYNAHVPINLETVTS